MNITRDRIMSQALMLFNENGIEYVGMREIASSLGMRIGNITYYFPTKDHLVFDISDQYTAINSAIHTDNKIDSLYSFLNKTRLLFENGIRFQCILLSMVHLIERNPLVAKNYAEVRQLRKNVLLEDIKSLIASKYLVCQSEEDETSLVGINSIINRFWMSETTVSGSRLQIGSTCGHYLKLLAHLFKPYTTKKGRLDIEQFLENLKGSKGKLPQ